MNTPAEIRSIFGANLLVLSKDYESITALALELGINRTQFNRYLSGESFPRPDVLSRICDFFKVDARILLEPLVTEEPESSFTSLAPFVNDYFVSGRRRLSEDVFPSGFYKFSRRSFIEPDLFVIGLIFVFREDQNTFLKGYETCDAVRMQSLPTTREVREFRGIILQQEEGIAIIASRKRAMTSSFNYLHRVASFDNNFWVGYITRTVPESSVDLRVTRLVYEYIPQNTSSVLQAARAKGFYTVEQLAPFHRRLLRPDVNFA